MFHRSAGKILINVRRKKIMMKSIQCFFYRLVTGIHPLAESSFKRFISQKTIMILQCIKKMKKIGSIKCAMDKINKWDQVFIFKMQNEIMGSVVHPAKQPVAGINNAFPVSPRKNGGEKPGYFYILLLCKPVWDADRIMLNKKRLIIFINLFIQKIFQTYIIHAPNISTCQSALSPLINLRIMAIMATTKRM